MRLHPRLMPMFRARAQLRRTHGEEHWALAGVFVDEAFHPVSRSVGRLTKRQQAEEIDLPAVIAPNHHEALRRSLFMARQLAPEIGTPAAERAARN